MERRSRTTGPWRPPCFAVAVVLLVFACGTFASGQETKRSVEPGETQP